MNAHSRRFLVSASFFISFFIPALAFAQTPLPTCTLTATPTSVIVGGSVTLTWSSTNATSGTISHIGNVGAAGSLNILPSSAQQTTFTGTFVGPGGTATCSTLVTVTSGSGNTGQGGTSGTGAYGVGGGSADPTLNYETPQNTYTPTSYTVNPANFQTQPSNNTFSQTPAPVLSNNTSNNKVSSFLVPCGLTSVNYGTDNGSPGPFDASGCNLCDFGQLIQNIINFLVILSIPLSAGLFAWAGILLFTSGANNPKGRDQAKKIFTSVILGLVIALSGYLIVQTLLNTLLSSGFQSGGWSWNSLQCTGNRPRNSTVGQIFQNLYSPTGTGVTAGTANGGLAPASNNTGACDPSAIAASASANNVSLSSTQASFLACVAKPESACGTKVSGATVKNGPPSSAFGAFQVVVSTNATCVNNNVCAQAAQKAGYNVPSGGLNCKTAVAQGMPAGQYAGMAYTDPNNLGMACIAAGVNFDCSVASASCLLQHNPNGSDWSNASDGNSHAGQQACTGILQQ